MLNHSVYHQKAFGRLRVDSFGHVMVTSNSEELLIKTYQEMIYLQTARKTEGRVRN